MKGKDSWSVEANLIASRLRMSCKQIKYKKIFVYKNYQIKYIYKETSFSQHKIWMKIKIYQYAFQLRHL